MRKFGKHRDKYSGRGHAGGNEVKAASILWAGLSGAES